MSFSTGGSPAGPGAPEQAAASADGSMLPDTSSGVMGGAGTGARNHAFATI